MIIYNGKDDYDWENFHPIESFAQDLESESIIADNVEDNTNNDDEDNDSDDEENNSSIESEKILENILQGTKWDYLGGVSVHEKLTSKLVAHFVHNYNCNMVKWPTKTAVAVRFKKRIENISSGHSLEKFLYKRNSDTTANSMGLFSCRTYKLNDVICEFTTCNDCFATVAVVNKETFNCIKKNNKLICNVNLINAHVEIINNN